MTEMKFEREICGFRDACVCGAPRYPYIICRGRALRLNDELWFARLSFYLKLFAIRV